MITIHQRHRETDRQTDRQTTCDRNTALCTKVHRAVIKVASVSVLSDGTEPTAHSDAVTEARSATVDGIHLRATPLRPMYKHTVL